MMLLLHLCLVSQPVLTGMMLLHVIYQDQGNKARAQVQSLLFSLFFLSLFCCDLTELLFKSRYDEPILPCSKC